MGKTIAEFTISLDGFVAGPDHGINDLFGWYSSGDTEFSAVEGGMEFKVARASAELLRESWGSCGAIVTGRRDFDVSKAWGGQSPLGVPIFIVTHRPPQEWAGTDAPFTFVADGVASAIAQAQAAAGSKNVGVGGTTIVQQSLQADLIDEIILHQVPILLGDGIRLFGSLPKPVELKRLKVIETPDVTHLLFQVVR